MSHISRLADKRRERRYGPRRRTVRYCPELHVDGAPHTVLECGHLRPGAPSKTLIEEGYRRRMVHCRACLEKRERQWSQADLLAEIRSRYE